MAIFPQGRRSLGVAIAVITISLWGPACSQPKPSGPAEPIEGIGITPGISPNEPTIFPHPEDWAKASQHGPVATLYGAVACLQCHKKISTQAEPIPTCASCHPLYPHQAAEQWGQASGHGNTYLVKGRAVCATECHGTDLGGGLSGISCQDCHATFPHTPSWFLPTEHGNAARGSGKNVCKNCHGENWQGGNTGVSCTVCHADYPHPPQWVKKEKHGGRVLQNGVAACATQCHGSDLGGGLSGVSCDACHNLYPHANDWRQSHGEIVHQLGLPSCQSCHGENLQNTLNDQNCFSCHEDYPHPPSAQWIPYEDGHGEKVREDYGGNTQACELCHGDDLLTEKNGETCFSCHPSYPHQASHPGVPLGAAWNSSGGHGVYTVLNTNDECTLCHGSDYQGGERDNPSCTSCHALYPHAANWRQPENHGAYVLAEGQNTCATQCHGLDLNGGQSGLSCTACHELYPHADDWETGHGASANQLGLAVCQDCHGEDFQTVLNGQTCFSCHEDYPHPAEADWLAYESGHGKRVRETYLGDTTACQTCHGDDLLTEKNGETCFSCHPSYLHDFVEASLSPPASWENYEGHGQYTLLHGKEVCALCHGADFQGGDRGNPSCYACHPAYPHLSGWRNPSGQPQGHGNFVQAEGAASCATARCHGVDLIPMPGFSQGISCNACHETYPHSDDWSSGLVHGPLAKTNIGICKTCHGLGLNQAPPGNSTCQDCHPAYLQHATAQIEVTPWASYEGHGQYVLGPPNNGNMAACQLCHGADYLGGISNVSCQEGCHPSFPHPPAGEWGPESGHGAYIQNTPPIGDLSRCQLCHGGDLSGGHSGQSCFECHPGYPHSVVVNWSGSGHGLASLNLEDRAACGDCHGEDLLGGDSAVSCKSCHTNFPHPAAADWTETWFEMVPDEDCLDEFGDDEEWCSDEVNHVSPHAAEFLAQQAALFPPSFNSCANCHGADYAGGNASLACSACHGAPYPHGIDPNWVTVEAGTHAGAFLSGASDLESACTLCHSGGIGFGTGLEGWAPACGSCHAYYPHLSPPQVPANQDWLLPDKHGIQGLLAEMTGSSTCRNCHGDDLSGEGASPSCATCHEHYDSVSHYGCCSIGGHPNGSWRLPVNHGRVYLLARDEGDPARCTGCHSWVPRDPPTVCNPFDYQELIGDDMAPTPAGWLTWCSACHTLPGGGCPADGCATPNPNSPGNGDCP